MSLTGKHINLDLLQYKDHIRLTEKNGKKYIYDIIRKKNLILQPEELVRQLMICWLTRDTTIHRNRIQVEKLITVNGLSRRFDIMVYDALMQPYILVECKAPDVPINQSVFDQIAVYHYALQTPFLIVTNGLFTYIAEKDAEEKKYRFYSSVPPW